MVFNLSSQNDQLSQVKTYIIEIPLWKYFGEDVCNLLSWWAILQINDLIMHKSSDAVHMNLDVFGSLPQYWISWDMNGTLVVTIDDCRILCLNPKLSKYSVQPQTLSRCIHNYFIFCLCRWKYNCTLILIWPTDCSIWKHTHISRSLFFIIVITFQIRVNKTN